MEDGTVTLHSSHHPLRNLYSEDKETQNRVFDEYYKVTFVRNPLVRLVSGYRNKIVRAVYTTMIQVTLLSL